MLSNMYVFHNLTTTHYSKLKLCNINALKFSKDDIIDIISMNASGLWRGKCEGKVGNFKFVNVEILEKTPQRQRSRSRSLRRLKKKPTSIIEVLKILGMAEHSPIMVLNGYENLSLLKVTRIYGDNCLHMK